MTCTYRHELVKISMYIFEIFALPNSFKTYFKVIKSFQTLVKYICKHTHMFKIKIIVNRILIVLVELRAIIYIKYTFQLVGTSFYLLRNTCDS